MLTGMMLQPLLEADNQHWAVGVVSGIIGAVGGALSMRAWHQSKTAKEQEVEKEKKKIAAAEVLLDRIKKEGHRFLHMPLMPSYEDAAKISGPELQNLKVQLRDLRVQSHEHQEQLEVVTGKHAPEGEGYYLQARAVYQELVKYEKNILHCEELLRALDERRNSPLHAMHTMEPFIRDLQIQAHAPAQLAAAITRYYGAAETRDGIKNLPFVCAVEDMSRQLALVKKWKSKLEEHKLFLKHTEPLVETKLAELHAWQATLQHVTEIIASNQHYQEQVAANNISKNARLNAQAEFTREQQRLAREEKRLQAAKAEAQKAENERARLAIEAQQSLTNLAQSSAQALNSTTNLLKEQAKAKEREKRDQHDEQIAEEQKLFCLFHQRDSRYCVGNDCYCAWHHVYKGRCPDRTCPVHQQ